MGIRLGGFDPLQLTFNTLNVLMKKGLLTLEEATHVLKESLPPDWSDQQKNKLIEKLIIKS